MTDRELFCGLLAIIWGVVWAGVLQLTPMGRFLAARRTWLSVVIGVAGVLAILLYAMPWEIWLRIVGAFGLSSLGIIGRSLYNELREHSDFVQEIGHDR